MARGDPTTYVKLPAALKERLEASAHENRRSLTAEIVHILMTHFAEQDEEADDRKNGASEEHKVGLSIGMDDPRDRAAALKTLLLKERMLLKRRVDQLGGRDSVLKMEISEIAKMVEGDPITGTASERKSHYSTMVALTPLSAILTSEELDKVAQRLAALEKANK